MSSNRVSPRCSDDVRQYIMFLSFAGAPSSRKSKPANSTPDIGSIGKISIAITKPCSGAPTRRAATWLHPPGAAPRSTTRAPFLRKCARSSISINLYAARERMIVREVTPPGSFGKVFGFVSTGFNIGGIVSPLIFGAVMDHGSSRMVFLLVVAFSLLGILTVATRPRRTA